jgi:glutamyl-tRNA reductase
MIVVGLSHRTASIEIRERVALDEDAAEALLRHLIEGGSIAEAMVVSTCNRLELYFVAADGEAGARAVDDVIDALHFSPSDIGKSLYFFTDAEAVQHLFRVAASLDSLVVGEPQILGQLKLGFERARLAKTVGAELHRAATRAFRAAKRVRTETNIGSGQVSVATVALDLARQIFDQLRERAVALVGSGEMGEAIAQLLRQSGARLVLLGRNELRVAELSRRVGAEGRLLSELERTLADVDVVVTSTSATLPVITYEQVRAAMKRRRGRDLFFVDVAVPRDVDQRAGEIAGVYLYNIDDLSSVVAASQHQRQDGAVLAEQIVQEELQKLERIEEAEQVIPTVRALHTWLGEVLRAEVNRSLHGGLKGLSDEERQSLSRLVDAAAKKLLHQPATTLKRWAVERPIELQSALEVVHELFLPQPSQRTNDDAKSYPESVPPASAKEEISFACTSCEYCDAGTETGVANPRHDKETR